MVLSEIERLDQNEIENAYDLSEVINRLCDGYFKEPNDIIVRFENNEIVFFVEVPDYYINDF